MITHTLAHLLYFSCLLLPSVESLQSTCREDQRPAGRGGGSLGSKGAGGGMMQPRWRLIISAGLKTVFWIDFESTEEVFKVQDISVTSK